MNYQELAVHPLSRKVIITEYGSDHIQLTQTAVLTSLITSPPTVRRVETPDRISLVLPDECKALVHPDAGWTLYRLHMHQLYSWMTTHTVLGVPAYSAMRHFYQAHDLDDDDLPFDRTYKVYQRASIEKKSPKSLVFFPNTVLGQTSNPKIELKDCFATLARLVHASPESMIRADGTPDVRKIRKLMLHAMVHVHGMPQKMAAEYMGMTPQGVSDHLSRLKVSMRKASD